MAALMSGPLLLVMCLTALPERWFPEITVGTDAGRVAAMKKVVMINGLVSAS